MRIIVSDTSFLIDCRKAALLTAVFSLPYRFVMPRILFDDELLSLSPEEKSLLLSHGLALVDLDGPGVLQAQTYFNAHRALKLNDCFALVLAQDGEETILLSGDKPLRKVAESKGVEVHGMLWVIDELEREGGATSQALHDALVVFLDDPLVFLPKSELLKRLRKFERLLNA